jgi:SAM-dependent methyltransferase
MEIKEKGMDYYDENVKETKKDRASFSATLKTRAKIISKLMKKYNLSGKLLDAGCGTGHILCIIIGENKKRFESVEGIDFSAEACKNTSCLLNIKTFPCDLRDISGIKDKYDVIICSEVIEHIADDNKVLLNLYSLLNTNGKLLITVPYLRKNWGKFDEISGHVRRYDKNELEDKLKGAGFTLLESFGWGNFFYSLYFALFLKNSNPHSSLNKKNKKIRPLKKAIFKFTSDILACIFLIDNLFISKKGKGKTLFVIAEK